MKNNLFVYGCSFTYGNGCLPADAYNVQYKKDGDKIWIELVAERMNLRLHNYAMGAYSNDKILDSMIKSFDLINEGDVVLIQKTFTHRYDIGYRRQSMEPYVKKMLTITPTSMDDLIYQGYSKEEANGILYTMWCIDTEANDMRTNSRFQFFEKILKYKNVKVCLVWDVLDYYTKYETIKDATSNKINDSHWSYKGHREFTDDIITLIKKVI